MKKPSGAVCAVTFAQVAAFRLARHHLLSPAGSDPVAVCRDVCGVQAQLMPAAQMNIAARTLGLTPARIEAALWQERSLVKTLCMRQTVHLLPAARFHVYAAAVRRSRVAAVVRIMARFGITAADRQTLLRAILETLAAGPVPNRELTARVRPRVSSRVRAWMDRVWNANRLALVEGLICYGPGLGQQVTFVRVDRWLPGRPAIAEGEAQRRMLADFLRAYGPASLRDFSKWSGIPVAEARRAWESLADQLAEVSLSARPAWLLRKDLHALRASAFDRPVVSLLAAFDSYLLAHVEKDQFLEPRHYKRVFRSLGWISPVVLVNGRVAGTWRHSPGGSSRLTVSLELFAKPSRSLCDRIEQQAARHGDFLGRRVELKFVRL
ncbi:MAG TPA: winged helix DNA-binding domain-containing protein [Candidatus Acidoferrales bacterium]|nr:winged helix DNA-binding domain-containing protein [Candidatus Acidoferrales bacterium]